MLAVGLSWVAFTKLSYVPCIPPFGKSFFLIMKDTEFYQTLFLLLWSCVFLLSDTDSFAYAEPGLWPWNDPSLIIVLILLLGCGICLASISLRVTQISSTLPMCGNHARLTSCLKTIPLSSHVDYGWRGCPDSTKSTAEPASPSTWQDFSVWLSASRLLETAEGWSQAAETATPGCGEEIKVLVGFNEGLI